MATLYTHNNKLVKINNKFIQKYEVPPPSFDSVQIGNQIWMSKNLAIDDGGEGITTRTVNYGQGDVVEYYYTWNTAVRVAASISGWHLPTREEFNALASYIGSAPGKKLKSTYGWNENRNGTDVFGFTGLPAGIYSPSYSGSGAEARFWSSSQSVDYENLAYFSRLYYGDSSFGYYTDDKTEFYSVRLIKDS